MGRHAMTSIRRTGAAPRLALLLASVGLVLAACDVAGLGLSGQAGKRTADPPSARGVVVATASPGVTAPDGPSADGPTALASRAPTPDPTASPTPTPSPTPSVGPRLSPAPTSGPFEMDLYRAGDFVSEAKKIWCVPAAMQVMANIMSPAADRTVATQRGYYALARKLSPATLHGDGAEPEGWAAGLERLGFGRYRVIVQPTLAKAIRAAALAIRTTGRPAGLLVWYGAHSWVMSGFRATADPALTSSFKVTGVYIQDVWYPKISTIWGASDPPDTLVPVSRLPRDFLPWRMPGGPYPDKAWKYVIVVPVAEPAVPVTASPTASPGTSVAP